MTPYDETTFGGRVRTARRRANLTIVELAELCGVSRGYLSMLERNKRPKASRRLTQKIADITHVTSSYLYVGTGVSNCDSLWAALKKELLSELNIANLKKEYYASKILQNVLTRMDVLEKNQAAQSKIP